MVSRGGTLETALQSPNVALQTPISFSGNSVHESLGISWHMPPDAIVCQPVL